MSFAKWCLFGLGLNVLNSSDTGDGIFQFSGATTIFADALAPKVTSASPGMVFTVWDRQHALLFQS